MKSRLGLRELTAASIVTSAVAFLAPSEIGDPVALLFFFFCTGLMIAAARRHTGATATTAWLLAATATLQVTGVLVRGIHGELIGEAQPMPSPADLLHVPAYIAFLLTILSVHRARVARRDLDAWLDAAAIVLAVVIVMWLGLVGDFITNDDFSAGLRTLNTLYNVLIIVAGAVLLRITSTPGLRPVSYYILGVSCVAYVIADLAATYSLIRGAGLTIAVGLSPLVYGFAAAAIRHETAPMLTKRHEEREIRIGTLRLVVVSLTILTPLAIVFRPGESTTSKVVLFTVSGVLVGTVVTRVVRILRRQEEMTQLDRSLATEVARLAALDSRQAVANELLRSARSLLGSRGDGATFSHSADDGLSIPLPGIISQVVNHEYLIVRGHDPSPSEERVLRSLVRDASLVADSIEGHAAKAREESEREANERIAQNERRFRALVQHSSDVIVLVDDQHEITYVSDSVEHILDKRAASMLGTSVDKLVHRNDRSALKGLLANLESRTDQQTGELRFRTEGGRNRLMEVTITDMRTIDAVEGIVINGTDITDTRNLEKDLRNAETIDRLTGLYNRPAFIEQLDLELRRTDVTGVPLAIALIDLTDFKSINDGLGPVHADAALVEVGQRIRQAVRLDDTVARISGDEFAVLMPDGYTSIEAVNVVERVLSMIKAPFEIQGLTVSLAATAGIAINTGEEIVALDMIRNADTALTLGKETRAGEAILFEDEMGEEAVERVELRNAFLSALDNEELRLVYQPIISMETGEIVSMEALSRWTHPDRGPISPGIFIPIAEESDAIEKLGIWVLTSACRQIVEWEELGYKGFTVSVNMSGQQLRDDRIVEDVARILDETGADPHRLVIEITESVLIDNTDLTASRIQAIRELGVKLAIDDFGTGYSSLSYLQRYEFDVLKIDRSFVVPLGIDAHSREREVVASIIGLANGLGAVTVAEGIEKHAEFSVLRELGCTNAQGFLFYYPLEVEDVPEALGAARIAA